MIVVVGRPTLAPVVDGSAGDSIPGAAVAGEDPEGTALSGTAAGIALAARAAGHPVELVGSVPDDGSGDATVLALGRAGIGHAAVLRDPSSERPTRLDAGDVSLGLSYISDCRVLVVAEPLPRDVLRVAADAAAYHGAHLVAIVGGEAGSTDDLGLPPAATVLEAPPAEGAEPADPDAFATAVGRYAAELVRGADPRAAFEAAIAGWESVGQ